MSTREHLLYKIRWGGVKGTGLLLAEIQTLLLFPVANLFKPLKRPIAMDSRLPYLDNGQRHVFSRWV